MSVPGESERCLLGYLRSSRHLTSLTTYARLNCVNIDREVLAEICERNDIGRLHLFGSFARGDESDASDVDLIADFTQRKSLLDLVRIEREFSERLGRKVDLLTERALSPHLRERILRESRLVYERAA